MHNLEKKFSSNVIPVELDFTVTKGTTMAAAQIYI